MSTEPNDQGGASAELTERITSALWALEQLAGLTGGDGTELRRLFVEVLKITRSDIERDRIIGEVDSARLDSLMLLIAAAEVEGKEVPDLISVGEDAEQLLMLGAAVSRADTIIGNLPKKYALVLRQTRALNRLVTAKFEYDRSRFNLSSQISSARTVRQIKRDLRQARRAGKRSDANEMHLGTLEFELIHAQAAAGMALQGNENITQVSSLIVELSRLLVVVISKMNRQVEWKLWRFAFQRKALDVVFVFLAGVVGVSWIANQTTQWGLGLAIEIAAWLAFRRFFEPGINRRVGRSRQAYIASISRTYVAHRIALLSAEFSRASSQADLV